MLDIDICVHLARGTSTAAEKRFLNAIEGEIVISVVAMGELHYGSAQSTRRSQSERAVELLLRHIPVVSLKEETSRIYGGLRATLETQGEIIGNNDLWIASHALSLELILVTNNLREFRRVPDLKIENWLQEAP
jgi:tRNA(fMet)-specific endonuclease VapC